MMKSTSPRQCWRALCGAAGVAHHPELTRLLVERGADPNEIEVPYHSPKTLDNRVMKIPWWVDHHICQLRQRMWTICFTDWSGPASHRRQAALTPDGTVGAGASVRELPRKQQEPVAERSP